MVWVECVDVFVMVNKFNIIFFGRILNFKVGVFFNIILFIGFLFIY